MWARQGFPPPEQWTIVGTPLECARPARAPTERQAPAVADGAPPSAMVAEHPMLHKALTLRQCHPEAETYSEVEIENVLEGTRANATKCRRSRP